ncbi:MAG TPA: hypothetical protein VNK95_19700 [Caldilineaceae bacterium]|nr:hypothetical protein [Caldilineaceae bacterium]
MGYHQAEDDWLAPAGALADEDLPGEAWDESLDPAGTPSLSIILFSAACGVAGGIIGLYVSYVLLQLNVPLSAGAATLSLLFSLGISGAVLSALAGSRSAPVNILFSCGLILLAFFFLTLCTLFGALAGTLLVRL